MPRPRRTLLGPVVAAAALLALLAGCGLGAPIQPDGGGSPDDSGDPVSIGELRAPITPELRRLFTQHVHWSDCGDESEPDDCAEIEAPMDWWHPDPDDTITLALIRHRATGTRTGTVVVNPGGPGGSGVDFVGSGVDGVVSADVAEHDDVIGFDPRGVGYSTAVDCGGARVLDDYLYGRVAGEIGSKQWISATRAHARAFAAECRRHSGSLLEHIDSVSAAHDLELIRRVLRLPKLDYLGYSYGSYLGTLYAGLFPKAVGRFVFDGIEDPWQGDDGSDDDPVDLDPGQAEGFDDALHAFLRACLAGRAEAVGSHDCPYTGALSAAATRVKELLDAARRHPLRAADGRTVSDAVLATGISEALYSTDDWPRLADGLTGAASGDPTGLLELADEYNGRDDTGEYFDNSTEAFLAIQCLEGGSAVDLTYDRHELAGLRKSAPVLGPYSAYGDLTCSGWRGGPTPFPKPIIAHGSGPILLVSTTGDPATPYDAGVDLADQLAEGHLVTFHGDGHTAYDLGDSCVDDAVDAFLLDGTVPHDDPDCH